jgi:hypothetical protein
MEEGAQDLTLAVSIPKMLETASSSMVEKLAVYKRAETTVTYKSRLFSP